MARKKEDNEHYIIEQVQKVIDRITGKSNLANMKTWDDLRDVAYQWCCKNYKHSEDESESWGVAPIYLILTALLYVEHPLLVGEGRSWKYPLPGMVAIIAKVEVNRHDIGIPIKPTDYINRDVERIAQPVERIEK